MPSTVWRTFASMSSVTARASRRFRCVAIRSSWLLCLRLAVGLGEPADYVVDIRHGGVHAGALRDGDAADAHGDGAGLVGPGVERNAAGQHRRWRPALLRFPQVGAQLGFGVLVAGGGILGGEALDGALVAER